MARRGNWEKTWYPLAAALSQVRSYILGGAINSAQMDAITKKYLGGYMTGTQTLKSHMDLR